MSMSMEKRESTEMSLIQSYQIAGSWQKYCRVRIRIEVLLNHNEMQYGLHVGREICRQKPFTQLIPEL